MRVKTLDGAATIRVPAGVQSGTSLRLRGCGVKTPSGQRGDIYVKLKVVTPQNLGKSQRKAMEEFAKEVGLRF